MRHHTALILLGLLGLTACAGPLGAGSDDPRATLAGSWQLTGGTGPDGGVPILDTHPITLVVEDDDLDTLGGTAACNHYGGTLQVTGGQLEVTELFWTEMGCMPMEAMQSEQAYLAALAAADDAARDGDTLELTGPDVELTFERLPEEVARPLVGTVWVLDTLLDGEGASSTPQADDLRPATLELGDDGAFVAGTGCNELLGSHHEGDGTLEFADLVTTDVACPPDLAPLEDHVLAVLGDGPVDVVIDGARLTLTTPDGIGLSYRAEDADSQ